MYAYPVAVKRVNEREWLANFENLNWQAKFQCTRAELVGKIRDEIKVITGNPDAAIAYKIV